jgi:hypothetical protein
MRCCCRCCCVSACVVLGKVKAPVKPGDSAQMRRHVSRLSLSPSFRELPLSVHVQLEEESARHARERERFSLDCHQEKGPQGGCNHLNRYCLWKYPHAPCAASKKNDSVFFYFFCVCVGGDVIDCCLNVSRCLFNVNEPLQSPVCKTQQAWRGNGKRGAIPRGNQIRTRPLALPLHHFRPPSRVSQKSVTLKPKQKNPR